LVVSLIASEVAPLEADQPEHQSRTEYLTIAWSKPSAIRKREILGDDKPATSARPIRSEARTRLLKAVAQGRCWMDQLISGDAEDISALAATQLISEKTVRSTLSLAFLAPDIVQAAIDGRLPRGLGVSQMTDLPADWVLQRQHFGLG
jgi:site-specific DNA recombinase